MKSSPANLPSPSVSSVERKAPTHEQLVARARALWETKGRPVNRDEEIWLEAERLLVDELSPGGARAERPRDPNHIDRGELNATLNQFGEPDRRSPTSAEPT